MNAQAGKGSAVDLTHALVFLASLLGSFIAQRAHDRAKDAQQDKAIEEIKLNCAANHPRGAQSIIR
jgi:hypothetical protein